MAMQPIEVIVRWEAGGKVAPLEFSLDGVRYRVESTGRTWRDEAGLHILVLSGQRAFDLIFNSEELTWSLGYQAPSPNWV
jgi:hypothetical protein